MNFSFITQLFKSDKGESLRNLIKDGAFLVDVRSPEEFARGSVNTAVNIPLERIQNSLVFLKTKSNVVLFCRSGNRSGQAKYLLEKSGLTNVTNGGTWQHINELMDF